MTRARSPQYPSLSLPQAIDLVAKLHKFNRTSVITRETAAKDMGYSGLTGRSLTVLATLTQFGLIEKAGKGDIKVARRAVDILHSVEQSDRAEAIQEAAFAPGLFQQLRDRFPEGVPSQNALRSYLIQMEFGDVAIGPAISAYLETNAFAENAKESERTGSVAHEAPESPDHSQEAPMQHQSQDLTPKVVPPAAAFGHPISPDLNQINMDIRGDQVAISGLLDLKGLSLLEKKIAALKLLLDTYTDANDAGGDETVQ